GPDTPVSDLAEQMVSHDIHRVVIREDLALIGIVSSLDILRAVSQGRLS
ncbi:MAG: CBS domain-containing protein, partial [Gemmatimonadetes bacterium]|nr:CBS domain-containing protein [Gemmatimonadota bacterium]